MSLYWGVTPVILRTKKTTDDMIASVERIMLDKKLAKRRDLIVITAGRAHRRGRKHEHDEDPSRGRGPGT